MHKPTWIPGLSTTSFKPAYAVLLLAAFLLCYVKRRSLLVI
jgi:hypothetical protein